MTKKNKPFTSPKSIEYPEFFRPGMGTENIGPLLRALVQMIRPNRVLEIGAGYKPAEIKIDKDVSEKCIMFVYPKEPTMAISDSFISTRDNTKEWLNP